MDHQDWVTADRGGKVCIKFEGEPKMANVESGIYSFRHSSDGCRFDKHFCWATIDRTEHFRNVFAGGFSVFIFKFEAECLHKGGEIHNFLPIRSIMNAINESGVTFFAISSMHIRCHLSIGKKHEVLDEFISILTFFSVDSNGFA